MKNFVALAAAGALCIAGTASAADLTAVKGAVMVQQNGKMVAAEKAGVLKAGDRVVASKGTAQVKFEDGCVISLKAGSMITVGAKSPCAAGAGAISANSAQAAQGGEGLTWVEGVGWVAAAVAVGVGISNVTKSQDTNVSVQ